MFLFFKLFGLVNGLEEEGGERLEGVLVHVVDNTQLDEHEVKHGTLGCDSSVDLSGKVDLLLSLYGDELLLFDLGGGLLCDFQGLDQFSVLQDCVWIGIGKLLEKACLQACEGNLELVLLVHQIFLCLFKIWLFRLDNHCK